MTERETFYADTVARLAAEGNLRRISLDDAPGGLIDLSTNDYLGLASRPELQEEFFADSAKRQIPLTSSASRLLAARQLQYTALEEELGRLYDRAILLFNSGYHANTGIVSALASAPRTLIVADRLVHASIIDGMTLSKMPFTRFRHNDFDHLERTLDKARSDYDRFLVIVESVYSMDGDRADIEKLIDIKRRHKGVMLYVDEAHAFGAEGRQGLGLVNDSPRREEVDVIVGTFGKACASMGAFCAVGGDVREYLVNRSRSLIFSTALPPLNMAWTRFIINKMVDMDGERSKLKILGQRLQSIISPITPDFPIMASHIQPLVVGDPRRAVELSGRLLERGFKVLPIRVPTVPPGTDRLRISLSANLTMDDIEGLGRALKEIMQ